MMTDAFGRSWLDNGRLNVRFRTPARPGDTITVSGKVRKIDRNDGQTLVDCEVLCCNQQGESVITGEAQVRVKENEDSY